MLATILNSLYAIAAIASAAAALVLVGVTRRYADYTRKMVEEMRNARAAQVMPKLVIVLKALPQEADGAVLGHPRIVNVGTGPAMDVTVEPRTEPAWQMWRFTTPAMMPGESRDLFFTVDAMPEGEPMYRLDTITKRAFSLAMTGTYSDALGGTHAAAHTLDIKALAEQWWQTGPPSTVAGDQPLLEVVDRLQRMLDAKSIY